MQTPITVLMTTYNCAPYIRQAIKSILNQTYKDFELLIVDDGSTDNTEEVVNSFIDSRIIYKKTEHKGIGAAANCGLKLAKHEWIARMDADDICHPNRLENQIKYLNENQNLIISSWCAYFKDENILFVTVPFSDDMTIKKALELHSIITHQSSIYNKYFILNELGGYNEDLEAFIDYDLWLRAKNRATFFIIPQILVFARIRKQSVSNSKLYHNDKSYYKLQQKYLTQFDSNSENIILNGWREFFYGNKNLCRDYWTKIKLNQWNFRMFLAYLISFFPADFVNYFNKLKVRLRLKYLYDKKTKFKGLNKEFHKLLKEISR